MLAEVCVSPRWDSGPKSFGEHRITMPAPGAEPEMPSPLLEFGTAPPTRLPQPTPATPVGGGRVGQLSGPRVGKDTHWAEDWMGHVVSTPLAQRARGRGAHPPQRPSVGHGRHPREYRSGPRARNREICHQHGLLRCSERLQPRRHRSPKKVGSSSPRKRSDPSRARGLEGLRQWRMMDKAQAC